MEMHCHSNHRALTNDRVRHTDCRRERLSSIERHPSTPATSAGVAYETCRARAVIFGGGTVVGRLAIATEGGSRPEVSALLDLPVFPVETRSAN